MKIIVVEDEPILLSVISLILRREGFEVIECTNGFQAMKDIVLHNPDMVITDIMMPGESGFKVIAFIRERLKWRTPIIVISCLENETNILKGFDFGVDEYITKPFSLPEMVIRVNKLFKCKKG